LGSQSGIMAFKALDDDATSFKLSEEFSSFESITDVKNTYFQVCINGICEFTDKGL